MAEKCETPKQADDLATNADLEAFLERAIAASEGAPGAIPEAVAVAEAAITRLSAQEAAGWPSEGVWREMLLDLLRGDESAAQESLEAGVPIYYVEDDTPSDLLIKEHPDGRRELVRFSYEGDEVVEVL